MFGTGRNSSKVSMPNFFPDLVSTPSSSTKSTPKSKTIDSIVRTGRNRSRSYSSSSSSSGEETSCSSSSSRSVSPDRPTGSKREHSPDHVVAPVKRKKVSLVETSGECDKEMDALLKNNLDMRRLTQDRDELQKSFDEHREKLKELTEVEEKLVTQKELLEKVNTMIEEGMTQLETMETKELSLLQRIESLQKELHSHKEEWQSFREKMALSMGFKL